MKDQAHIHLESRENVGDQLEVYYEGIDFFLSCNKKTLTPNNHSSWSIELLTFTVVTTTGKGE